MAAEGLPRAPHTKRHFLPKKKRKKLSENSDLCEVNAAIVQPTRACLSASVARWQLGSVQFPWRRPVQGAAECNHCLPITSGEVSPHSPRHPACFAHCLDTVREWLHQPGLVSSTGQEGREPDPGGSAGSTPPRDAGMWTEGLLCRRWKGAGTPSGGGAAAGNGAAAVPVYCSGRFVCGLHGLSYISYETVDTSLVE